MPQSRERAILAALALAILAILPVVVLAASGGGGGLGVPGVGGPKKTPRPRPTPTVVASPAPSPAASTAPSSPPSAPPTATFVGAGDIASCSSSGDEATANLLDGIPGTVFTLGDNAYESGTATEFASCYDPTWGRHRARTMPVPGNHDYSTAGAAGFYGYFGAAAGDPSKGYYAYDQGTWRIYALNSNCGAIDGCGAGSPQEQWLRSDLAANPRQCVAALWHHPLFSSGEHGNNTITQALFQALYDAGGDLVLVGHDHDYERFGPQTPTGAADASRGIVEFVVGTGGRSHYAFPVIRPNSLVRDGTAYGVLKLDLGVGGYGFRFVPIAGQAFTDSGVGTCH